MTPEASARLTFEDRITPYDLANLVVYLRLLDADRAGADWTEVARVVLGLDLSDLEHAERAYRDHLARARWMTETGYRYLVSMGEAWPTPPTRPVSGLKM